MGQKIRPDSLRLGIVKDWQSRWFGKRGFRNSLEEDDLVRDIVGKKLTTAGVVSVTIERNASDLKVIIKAARPGLVIGRGGKGIEELTKKIEKELEKLHLVRGTERPSLKITIDELKRSEVSAVNVAQNVAWDLEKRMPFRRILKKQIDAAMQNQEVQGVKIQVGGRLNGSEIARREWLSKGKLPLQTLRANIDYGIATSFTTYGTIGVKVWLYKGEVFD